MLEKTFSLLYYLKKPKSYSKGLMPIYLRITIDGIAKEISTGRKCPPERWNSRAGRMMGTKEDARQLNSYLDTLQTKVFEVRRQLLEKDSIINADHLKATLKGTASKPRMLIEIFDEHNKQMQSLVGKDFSVATLKRYKTSLGLTKQFIEWKYGMCDLDIKRLNYEFLSQYEFWLKAHRNCNHNTTMKYLSNFRKVVNRCIRNGWLEKDPFFGFKMTQKEVVPEFLNAHELHALSTKPFTSNRLNLIRDIFLFCSYTGLAFIDVQKLKTSEISVGIDGKKWIITNRQKTEVSSRIPLLPIALAILDKYSKCPKCVSSQKALPVPCNQKYNEYLKEIAALCGINKNLTSHTARHTFATTITLGNGVPIESVSKMLGHKNLRTTQHYAKVLDLKLSQDMHALKAKLECNEK
jgi:site-specific recombinase XerD